MKCHQGYVKIRNLHRQTADGLTPAMILLLSQEVGLYLQVLRTAPRIVSEVPTNALALWLPADCPIF